MNNTPQAIKKSGKLTQELQKLLVHNLGRGCSIEAATAMAGISRTSFYNWMRRGRRELDRLEADGGGPPAPGQGPYVDFWQAVESAIAKIEARNIRIIEEAARGGGELVETIVVLDASGKPARRTTKIKVAKPEWQAAKWLLERRFPGRWARPRLETRQAGDAAETENGQDRPDLSQLSDGELETLENLLEKTTGAGGSTEGTG